MYKQKRFQKGATKKVDLKNLAIFDKRDTWVGNILNINFLEEEVTYYSIFNEVKTKPFVDVIFFDKTTLEIEFFLQEQNQVNPVAPKEYFTFLFSNKTSKSG